MKGQTGTRETHNHVPIFLPRFEVTGSREQSPPNHMAYCNGGGGRYADQQVVVRRL